MKKLYIATVFFWIFSAFYAASSFAKDDIYTGIFSNKAVSGYDAVAYFTEKKPVKGSSKYTYKYLGVVWYFSSQENLNLFKKSPDKYRPQYGGYCAWAVAVKRSRAPGDPKYWKVVNGKLYLNYDQSIQNKWLKNIQGFIKQGDVNWAEMMKRKK